MSHIAVINQSTVVTDADGQSMVTAINTLLPRFCKDWGIPQSVAVYVSSKNTTGIPIKIFIKDISYIENALGYHDLKNNVSVGYVFAKTILLYGGGVLSSPNGNMSISQTLAHEIFELLVDPYANVWADLGDSRTFFAYEVCDPVDSNPLVVQIPSPTKTPFVFDPVIRKMVPSSSVKIKVQLADWVLPAWFNPQSTVGPFNHANTLKGPFTVSSGGYVILSTNGDVDLVFGHNVSDQKLDFITQKKRISARSKKMTSAPQSEFQTP
jgi:hypothetical protein